MPSRLTSRPTSNKYQFNRQLQTHVPCRQRHPKLKYAGDAFSTAISHTINTVFELHIPLDAVGRDILVPLPKQKKQLGPLSNLRPIALLNSIRKILSTVVLRPIQHKVNLFTGPCQSGFKQGRSCADIVWAQRILVSVVMSRHCDSHKIGIYMSRAFETIQRHIILEVLACCSDDDLRLVRLLLADTHLMVRVRSA